MTTLAEDAQRDFQQGEYEEFPVIAADIVYKHACVGLNAAGYARPLDGSEDDEFAGFAESKVDNSAGSAGDKRVRCLQRGRVVLTVSGVAITDNYGAPVYAYDDDTFTTTGGSPSGSLIGWVSRFVSTGVAVVYFDAAMVRAALHS